MISSLVILLQQFFDCILRYAVKRVNSVADSAWRIASWRKAAAFVAIFAFRLRLLCMVEVSIWPSHAAAM